MISVFAKGNPFKATFVINLRCAFFSVRLSETNIYLYIDKTYRPHLFRAVTCALAAEENGMAVRPASAIIVNRAFFTFNSVHFKYAVNKQMNINRIII